VLILGACCRYGDGRGCQHGGQQHGLADDHR
jgi:hypothetical protein